MVFPSKLIIVMYNGKIPILKTYGPISSPFWCELPIIEQLVEGHYLVYEVLPDGTRVFLTMENYDQDNGGGAPPGPPTPPGPEPNPNTMAAHMNQKLETIPGIHGTLRYMHGHFEKYNATTHLWEVAYAEDKLEIVDSVVDTTVGGLKAGTDLENMTMDQIVGKLIHTSVLPSIAFTVSPSDTIIEKGVVINSVVLSAVVTKGENVIQTVKFYKDSTLINTATVSTDAVHTYTYTYNTHVGVGCEFKVEVIDTENTVDAVHDYIFILPQFKGKLSESAPLDSTAVLSLTKFVSQSLTIPLTVATAQDRVAIAIPATRGLVSVVDQNNYIVTGLFETINIAYTLQDSTIENYKLIVSTDPMTVTNFQLVFNLS